MKRIVVFNGIHGAGKSTLAKLFVEKNQGFTYFPEIGGQLRQEVSYNALQSKEDFDLEVMRRELARDKHLLTDPEIPVVETWHIGNMAYVLARNPHLFPKYEESFSRQLRLFQTTAIILDIPQDMFRSRATEQVEPNQMDELITFYEEITEGIKVIYKKFDIPHFSIKNDGLLEETVDAISELLATDEALLEGGRAGKEHIVLD